MTISVKLDFAGMDLIKRNVRNWGSDGLMSVALDGEAYAKRNMTGKGGAASAPGDFPAVQTGNLRAGIRAESRAVLVKRVVSSADYSVYLENGTRHMAARPVMRPTARYMAKQGPAILANVIARHIR